MKANLIRPISNRLVKHMEFLKESKDMVVSVYNVDRDARSSWLNSAVSEYESFLKAKAAAGIATKIIPCKEVSWIWHLHLLHPAAYRKYCFGTFKKLLVPHPDEILPNASLVTRFDLPQSQKNSTIPVPQNATWDVLFQKQAEFLIKMTNFATTAEGARAISSQFVNFFSLMHPMYNKNCPVRVPTLEIDMVWHAVLHSPDFYAREICSKLAKRFVDHNDLIADSAVSSGFTKTKALYEKTFNFPYELLIWDNKSSDTVKPAVKLNMIASEKSQTPVTRSIVPYSYQPNPKISQSNVKNDKKDSGSAYDSSNDTGIVYFNSGYPSIYGGHHHHHDVSELDTDSAQCSSLGLDVDDVQVGNDESGGCGDAGPTCGSESMSACGGMEASCGGGGSSSSSSSSDGGSDGGSSGSCGGGSCGD